tara:strand:- start:1662 stop:2264 length:603 start_codon:yes stop_codon:yes gene_type:complete
VRTPQDFRRENVKELFDKILKDNKTKLLPRSISINESIDSDFTSVSFSLDMVSGKETRTYNFIDIEGKGFVDAVFTTCYEEFVEPFPSIKNLNLVDLIVKPIFSMSRKPSGTDARTDVIFRVEIKNHGLSEFSARSSSIVHASFQVMMEAFQFYINCDRTFHRLGTCFEDASSRHRGDTAQECLTDLAKLTTVNTYERKR